MYAESGRPGSGISCLSKSQDRILEIVDEASCTALRFAQDTTGSIQRHQRREIWSDSLNHKQSLQNAVSNYSLPKSFIAVTYALNCQFAAQSDQRELACTFITQSKVLLAEQLEDKSVTNTWTCILLTNSYEDEQSNRLKSLYSLSIAVKRYPPGLGLLRSASNGPYYGTVSRPQHNCGWLANYDCTATVKESEQTIQQCIQPVYISTVCSFLIT